MKNIYKTLVALFAVLLLSGAVQKPAMAQRGNISFQVFYDQLSPYGQWTNYPNYGFVWIPDVDPDFSPYSTNGYWVMTEFGWTWVSDYPWGWAPFHYGRWDYDNYYGWFWVPDNEWGPSWVVWRHADNYYGWAPMRPGISISLSFGNDYRDIDRWNFVRDRDFGRHDMHNYYVNRSDNNVIIRQSVVINNTYVDNRRNVTYIAGPRGADVQRATGRRISNVKIQDNDRPGAEMKNNRLKIYRPQVQRNNEGNQKPAPTRVTDMKDIRRPNDRNSPGQQKEVSPVQYNRRIDKQTPPQQQQNVQQERRTQQQAQPQQQDRRTRQQQQVQPQQQERRTQRQERRTQQQQQVQPSQQKPEQKQKAAETPRDRKVKQGKETNPPDKSRRNNEKK